MSLCVQVLASAPEHLRAAQREIEVQQAARHPCLLPLLDWSVVPPPPGDAQGTHTIYMLSPAYTGDLRRRTLSSRLRARLAALLPTRQAALICAFVARAHVQTHHGGGGARRREPG